MAANALQRLGAFTAAQCADVAAAAPPRELIRTDLSAAEAAARYGTPQHNAVLSALRYAGVRSDRDLPEPLQPPAKMGVPRFLRLLQHVMQFGIDVGGAVLPLAVAAAESADLLEAMFPVAPVVKDDELRALLVTALEESRPSVMMWLLQRYGHDATPPLVMSAVRAVRCPRHVLTVPVLLHHLCAFGLSAIEEFALHALTSKAYWSIARDAMALLPPSLCLRLVDCALADPLLGVAFVHDNRFLVAREMAAAAAPTAARDTSELPNGDDLLCSAVRNDAMPLVRELLDGGWRIYRAQAMVSALCELPAGQAAPYFDELCARGLAEPMVAHETALCTFLASRRVHEARWLVERGARVDVVHGELYDTALHLAVRAGDLELVRALLERGVEVNVGNAAGTTALDVAQREHQAELAAFLAERGGEAGPSLILDVPEDILFEIFQHLEPRDIASVALTCKLFHSRVSDAEFWRLLCLRHHGLQVMPRTSWRESWLALRGSGATDYHSLMMRYQAALVASIADHGVYVRVVQPGVSAASADARQRFFQEHSRTVRARGGEFRTNQMRRMRAKQRQLRRRIFMDFPQYLCLKLLRATSTKGALLSASEYAAALNELLELHRGNTVRPFQF